MLLCDHARRAAVCGALALSLGGWAGSAAGALFRVDGSVSVAQGSIAQGIVSGSTGDLAGVDRSVTRQGAAPSPVPFAYWADASASASVNGLGTYAFGQTALDVGWSGFGQGTVNVRANSLAAARYDDVVITGPGSSVQTSFNMMLEGGISVGHSVTTALPMTLAQGRVDVNFLVNGIVVGGGTVQREVRGGGGTVAPVSSGSLADWNNGAVVISPTFSVPANVPFTLEVELTTRVYAAGFTGEPFNSSALGDFGHTLSFVQGAPVFNLPGGYTANSADAAISGNQSTVPEPGVLAMGLLALIAWGGRRPLSRGGRKCARPVNP